MKWNHCERVNFCLYPFFAPVGVRLVAFVVDSYLKGSYLKGSYLKGSYLKDFCY